jgi:16S rRNA (cytosine1402-N4)-methyltransferase
MEKQNQQLVHHPVMLKEVMAAMDLQDGYTVVDGTLGLGGYSEAVLESGKKVKVAAFDLDEENLKFAQARLSKHADSVTLIHDNFANLADALKAKGIVSINGLMLDLGLSSPQVDLAERGFSFAKDGPLDMRFDKTSGITAAEIINTYSLEELTKVFREYGEEKSAYRIAKAIIAERKIKRFETTTDLAAFVEKLMGRRPGKKHPATLIFQGLRIAVNRELDSLEKALNNCLEMLEPKGKIAVVSYHSLEDRLVKNFFRDNSKEYVNLPGELHTTYLEPKLTIVTKKPLIPTDEEISANPRARSAKLRVAEKN